MKLLRKAVNTLPTGLFLVSSIAAAANICVGPTATGNGSGADWNNVAQWSTLAFVRGNTYYLKEGTYGAKTLSTSTSGSNWIVVKKCTAGEGSCTAIAGWLDSMGDAEAVFTGSLSISSNYWEINGTKGGGPGSWKAGHGFKWTSSAGTNIDYISVGDGVSNIIVSRAKFEQIGNVDVTTARANGVYDAGALSNSRFEYLYFDNIGGLPWLLRNGSGNIFQYNYAGHICGMSRADYNQHCEGIVIHDMDDVHFRWNFISESPSSGGFVKNNTQTSSDIRIYGNVFGNGFPINCNTGSCPGWRIFNNTFYNTNGGPFGGDGGYSNLLAYNNITFTSSWSPVMPGTHDYNWYSRITQVACSMKSAAHENVNKNYPGSCDNVTQTLSPFLNTGGSNPEDWRLASAMSGFSGTSACAIDACTGEKKYNIDAFGNVRGVDGVWDVGAFEFQGGSGQSVLPPANLRIVP